MATKVKQKIPDNIQKSIKEIATLIKQDKENQKRKVGDPDGYKDFIEKILGKNKNDDNEYELTKDETQKLMYNISIIHYLIQQKKLEIEKIKLVVDEDYISVLELIKKTDDVFVVRKGCPSLTFKFPKEQLTNIGELIKKQKDIYNEINNINEEIKKSSSSNQSAGGGEEFMNHLVKVGELTNNFNSPYKIDIDSKSIYNNLENYNETVKEEFKKDMIEVEKPLEFSQKNQEEIQNLIDTLIDLSDLYYQYHKIFINLVLILKTLLQLNKKTYEEINDQIKDIQNIIFSKTSVLEGGVDTVSISDDCKINVPKLDEVKEEIIKLKKKKKIIIQVNGLDQSAQNKLKNILANTKDDFKINNWGDVKEDNKILIL